MVMLVGILPTLNIEQRKTTVTVTVVRANNQSGRI